MWQSLLVTDSLANVSAWLTVPDAADLLGEPLGRVRRLIEEHTLIGVKRDGVMMIPADCIQNGEALPSIRGTIHVLLDSGFTTEGAIEWLYTDEPTLGKTPMAALLDGQKTQIRRLAQALAL
ncbi:MAG: hypothetical protein RL196_329 [Actinomycetota bacterium]